MNADTVLQEDAVNVLTEGIIRCSYKVSNVLGCGFLEKVYENALIHELRKQGLNAEQQQPIEVWYDSVVVGSYVADIIVERQVLVELKAVHNFDEIHSAQILNYLRATKLKVGLLVNFGKPRVEIKRFVHEL